MKVTILDFRITDRVLAETEPDAGDIVYLGAQGRVAYPFVATRRIAGPGGVYIDAVSIIDADGGSLGTWEKKFELDGESKPRTITNELRGVTFPQPGTYTLQYSVYDDVVANFPFTVVQSDSPATGIVPGPLDASLSKSTICWLEVVHESKTINKPVWYGYENGRVYVLTGPGEQEIPGLTTSDNVRLIARSKDKRSQVADVQCVVEVLPKDAAWDVLARDLLLGRRLNLADGDAAVGRWKNTCEIAVLTPVAPATDEAAVAP